MDTKWQPIKVAANQSGSQPKKSFGTRVDNKARA